MPAAAQRRFAVHRCTVAVCLALGASFAAQAQPAQESSAQSPQAAVYRLDIPAQPLANALQAFARASGQQVSFDGAALHGLTSSPLSGEYTAEQALSRLLEGTGIAFRRGRQGVWMVGRLQATEEDATTLQNVVVTGTRIRGAGLPSPLISIGQAQIREDGHSDLGEVIRSIPQNFGGGQNPGIGIGSGSIVNQNINSGSALNLRGLGPDATLTLLNGRRLSYSGFVNAVDVSVIPVAALDRIEVIADGASAIYGSDAVAGVANIITRRDFDGVSAGYRTGTATDGGGTVRQAGLTAGTTWSAGGLIAAYDHTRSDAVFAHQRDYLLYMRRPNSILPEREQRSSYVGLYQDLGASATLNLDILHTERESLTTAMQPNQSLLSNPQTRVSLAAPSVDIHLPGEWTLSFGGSYGRDKTIYGTDRFTPEGVFLTRSRGCYCNTTRSLETGAEGPMFALPAGDSRVAMGVGYRSNDFEARSYTGTALDEGKRSSRYAYGEILVPLASPEQDLAALRRLELTAAFRHEDYGDMGNVTTPKLGFIYQPGAGLTFKSSWGKSYKAPNLLQQFQEYLVYLFPAATFGASGYPEDATALMTWGGNPDLKPERAESWTGSVLFHPQAIPGLELELGYFDIDYRDRVVQPVANTAAAFRDPVYGEFLIYAPSPELQAEVIAAAEGGIVNGTPGPYDPARVMGIVYNTYVNAARQRVRGFDLSGSYGLSLGPGRLTLRGSASRLEGWQRNSQAQPEFETVGMIFNPPKLRARAGAVWGGQRLTLSGFVNHVGGVTDDRLEEIIEGGSFNTVDLNIRYGTEEGGGLLSGLDLALSVHNLFDRRPPLVTPLYDFVVNYDSTNYSAIGRFVSVSVTKRW